jgi:predicted transcriptional regulator
VKFFNDILTGKDNLTYDAARVVGVLGAAAYIAFWSVQVACAHRFAPSDAAAYARGLGVVLLAMAGAVAIKRSTEPEPPSAPEAASRAGGQS